MSDNVTTYLNTLPEPTRIAAGKAWELLPPDVKSEMNTTLKLFSGFAQGNPAALGDLMDLLKKQAAPALAPLSKIAVVGPVNAGKSTLYNVLAGADEKAEVSPIPGTTVEAQEFRAGAISLVDTPGLDNSLDVQSNEYCAAMEQAENADFLIIVFDASRGITASDQTLYRSLMQLGKPSIAVLNKMDLIGKNMRQKVINSAAAALGLMPESIHAVSAEKNAGVGDLLIEAAVTEPRLLGELGRTVKTLRTKLAWQAIRRTSVISCAIALTPLPVIDFIPLTVNQTLMVLTMARIYDKQMNYKRAGELLSTLGLGMLARTLAAQLSKLGGPPGWAVSASIASACTVAIGYSVMLWFEYDIKPSQEHLTRVIKAVSTVVLEYIKPLSKKKKDRPKLDEAVGQAVDKVTRQLTAEEAEKILAEETGKA